MDDELDGAMDVDVEMGGAQEGIVDDDYDVNNSKS